MKVLLNNLYVQTQGSYLRLDHETLKIEVERQTTFQVPLHHLGGIVVFGNVLISPFLIHRCAADGRDLVWLSEHGRFQARVAGPTTGNVLLRRSQHVALNQTDLTLQVARHIVAGKLQNARQVLMRSAREANNDSDSIALANAAKIHAESIQSTEQVEDLDKLRGIEGYAAKSYFAAFSHMIRTHHDAFAKSGSRN
jgi:CRISP-associated protein Cas1